MDPQQPQQPVTLKTENDSLTKLREAWGNMVSDYPGTGPAIDPNYEVEYYAGTAITGAEFSVGILKDIAPKCDLEELRLRVQAQMESLHKELCVVFYSLQFLLRERRKN